MTGMGQYALHLWQEMRQDDDLNTMLLMPADAPSSVQALAGERAAKVAPPKGLRLPKKARKLWWEQTGIVSAARRAKVDLVHVPYFSAPLRQAVPYIVTVHDAIPLVLKEYAGGRAMGAYLKLVSRAVKGADLILTDSVFSQGDIERCLDIPASRIRPIPLAAGSEFVPAATDADRDRIAAVRERYGLGRPFVLNVGGFDRRKNLPALVEGFAMALSEIECETDLVIVGSPHSSDVDFFPPLQPVIHRHGLSGKVKLTGFVSEQDKLDLYRAATAFVFPSTYEGFGLNPLEAMACGTPVISSNRSSLPEVVGDGGMLIDPTPREIAGALVRLLNDPGLQESLRQRGLEQARTFSWRETARQTVQAYRDVLDNTEE